VEPEGGKRLQNIEQRTEGRQNSYFWDPLLDLDTRSEQAIPNTEGGGPVTECLPAEYEVGKIIVTRALDDLQRLQFNPIFPSQSA